MIGMHVCKVLNKQLYVWNAYLSVLGSNIVIAAWALTTIYSPVDMPMHWDRNNMIFRGTIYVARYFIT